MRVAEEVYWSVVSWTLLPEVRRRVLAKGGTDMDVNWIRKGLVVIALGAGLVTSSAQAEILQDLIDAGSAIVSGDKRFDNFGYLSTGDMPTADAINVVAITDANGNFGLRFQGGFVDLAGGSPSDALITYRVTVTKPDFEIVGARLAGNPAVTGAEPNGFIGVTESFLPLSESLNISAQNATVNPTAEIAFAQRHKTLNVQKSILGAAGRNAVTLGFVDQTFVQVPEPGSLILLLGGVGTVGIGAWRRKRKEAGSLATAA